MGDLVNGVSTVISPWPFQLASLLPGWTNLRDDSIPTGIIVFSDHRGIDDE